LSLRIFYDGTSFRYKGWKKTKKLLGEVIAKEGKISGDLNIIITKDEKVREINIEFLEHDYNTDVITFDYNSGNVVKGEIYISLDTVRVNSLNYDVSLRHELTRTMIHGILHLAGYDDKTDEEQAIMRRLEDRWLQMAGE
jgi:rRNA maturation RNase YbeY